MTAKQWGSSPAFAWVLTAAYVAWIAWLGLHHEPWRDEADVWLGVRDISLRHLFHYLRGAGNPALWYLMVMPLAKSGLAYGWMFVLNFLLAAAAGVIFAFKAPFSRLVKVLVLFGYFIGFEYSVVARPYMLAVLVLFLLADVWNVRPRRYIYIGILLALLSNTHAHGFFMAGGVGLVLLVQVLIERQFHRQVWTGMAIAVLGAILAMATAWPLASADPPGPAVRRWPVIGYVLEQDLVPHLADIVRHSSLDKRTVHHMDQAATIGGAMVLLSALYLMRKNLAAVSIVLLASAGMMYICVWRWYGGERHAGMFFLIMLFGLWISRRGEAEAKEDGVPAPSSGPQRWAERIFALGLAPSLLVGIYYGYLETRYEYSGAKATADFVRDHALTQYPIVNGTGYFEYQALLPWLPNTKVWFAGRNQYRTYIPWDGHWLVDKQMSYIDVVTRARQHFGSTPYLLLTSESPLPESIRGSYRLIYHNTGRVFGHTDENYYIYASDPSIKP